MELFRYKTAYQKIAMGFLSYIPGEKLIKQLKETIHQYETDPDWHLYLLKKGEDFIGLVGVHIEGEHWTLHHVSVNPSFRAEGMAQFMVEQMFEKYGKKKARGTKYTETFLHK